MNKILLLIPILFAMMITPALADDSFRSVIVAPLNSTGYLNANWTVPYEFNFTTDSGCSNVLLSYSTSITTDRYGRANVTFNITDMTEPPSYICEYQNGTLRATHYYDNRGLFKNIIMTGKLYFNSLLTRYFDYNSTSDTLFWNANFNASGNVTGNYIFGDATYMTNVPSAAEVDPRWSGNYSNVLFKTTAWTNDTNIGIAGSTIDWIGTLADGRIASASTWNNKAGIGNCGSGQAVQNTTTSGVQCFTPSTYNSSYIVTEADPLWSGNYTAVFSWNKTYADTLYYSITNPLGFINTSYNATYDAKAGTGTATCPSGQVVQNVTTTTGGITSQCVAQSTFTNYWNRSAPTIFPANFGDDVTLQNGSIYLDSDYYIDWLGNRTTFNSTSYRFEFSGSVGAFGTLWSYNHYPLATETYNLGNNTLRWNSTNTKNLFVGNSTGNITVTPSGVTLFGTARKTNSVHQYAYNTYGLAGTRNGVVCVASTLASLNSTFLFQTYDSGAGAGACESTVLAMQVPKDYEEGTNITIEVHWTSSATTGNVVWGVGVNLVGAGENYVKPDTWITTTESAPATAYYKKEYSLVFSGAGIQKDDDIAITIYRDADNAGDTMGADALVEMIGLHYTSNSLGE